jgi:hypothetical protein
VGEPGHREERDHRAIVRQRVHSAACHRSDAVQHLGRYTYCIRGSDELVRHCRERDTHSHQ